VVCKVALSPLPPALNLIDYLSRRPWFGVRVVSYTRQNSSSLRISRVIFHFCDNAACPVPSNSGLTSVSFALQRSTAKSQFNDSARD
jgi:hypothetical protein